jgi:hypothetical protein
MVSISPVPDRSMNWFAHLAQLAVEHADRGNEQRALQHDRGAAAAFLHGEIGPFAHGVQLC